VSVITPTYNRARDLAETIESIRRQDYPAIEHIVVDDGSTDTTAAVIDAVAPRSGYELRYLRQGHGGEAVAVNEGWRAARGAYVAIVNSDDPQPRDWLVTCIAEAERNPHAPVIYPDWSVIDESGSEVAVRVLGPYRRERLLGRAECLPGPGALIRRALVPWAALRRTDLVYYADYECWMRLSLIGDFVNVPKPVARWRAHAAGLSAGPDIRRRTREATAVIEAFFESPSLEARLRRHYPNALGFTHYQCARMSWRRMPALAAFHLFRALVLLGPRGVFPTRHLATALARRARQGLADRHRGPAGRAARSVDAGSITATRE